MIWLSMAMAFAARALLVALFLPFSALDKILNFKAAVGQAAEAIPSRLLARIAIVAGFVCRGRDVACRSDRHRRSLGGVHPGRLLRRDRAAVEAILAAAGFPVERDQRAAGRCSGIS